MNLTTLPTLDNPASIDALNALPLDDFDYDEIPDDELNRRAEEFEFQRLLDEGYRPF
jgi:hypothetical protein